ncbi:MAG: transporter [Gammaproteobacteria bacterium]
MKRWMATVIGFSLLVGSGFATTVLAAPQTFNTALPVAEGEFVLREQFLYRKATDDPNAADRELSVPGLISVLGYGINSDLAVFGVLPYLDKELDVTTPGNQRVSRETNGIGDARLFGRYTIYQHDVPGRNFRIAPFLGIELPTGDDDDRDSLGTLPAPLQSGSGSWDPFGGIVLTYQTLAYEVNAQAGYKGNTKANNFEIGDEATLDASLQYRLWPRELGEGVPGFLYGVLETNLRYQGKNEINGTKDANSGGTSFFLSPGVQYVTRRWILETIVQVPVAQDLNGTALEDNFIVRAGFRIAF